MDVTQSPRQAFSDACRVHLYDKTHRRLKKELDDIIWTNSHQHRNSSVTMSFRGHLYQIRKPERGEKNPHNLLKSSLRPRMKAYLEWKDKEDRAEAMGMGFILKILGLTDSTDDLRRLLPDSLHGVIDQFEDILAGGESRFSPTEAAEFLAENDHYVKHLKARMLHNLVDAGA